MSQKSLSQTVHARGGRGPAGWPVDEGTSGRDGWDQAEDWGQDIEELISRATFGSQRRTYPGPSNGQHLPRRERGLGRSWSCRSPTKLLYWLLGLGVVAMMCLGAYGSGYRLMRPPELQMARAEAIRQRTLQDPAFGNNRRSNIQVDKQDQRGVGIVGDFQTEDASQDLFQEPELPKGSDATQAALMVRHAQRETAAAGGDASSQGSTDPEPLNRPVTLLEKAVQPRKPQNKDQRMAAGNPEPLNRPVTLLEQAVQPQNPHNEAQRAAVDVDEIQAVHPRDAHNEDQDVVADVAGIQASTDIDTNRQATLVAALGNQELRDHGSAMAQSAEERDPASGLGKESAKEKAKESVAALDSSEEDDGSAIQEDTTADFEGEGEDVIEESEEVVIIADEQDEEDEEDQDSVVVSQATPDDLSVGSKSNAEDLLGLFLAGAQDTIMEKDGVINAEEDATGKGDIIRTDELSLEKISTDGSADDEPVAKAKVIDAVVEPKPGVSLQQGRADAADSQSDDPNAQDNEAHVSEAKSSDGLAGDAQQSESQAQGFSDGLGDGEAAGEQEKETSETDAEAKPEQQAAETDVEAKPEEQGAGGVDALSAAAELAELSQAIVETQDGQAVEEDENDEDEDPTEGLGYSLVPEDIAIPDEPISVKAKTMAALQHYIEEAEAVEREEAAKQAAAESAQQRTKEQAAEEERAKAGRQDAEKAAAEAAAAERAAAQKALEDMTPEQRFEAENAADRKALETAEGAERQRIMKQMQDRYLQEETRKERIATEAFRTKQKAEEDERRKQEEASEAEKAAQGVSAEDAAKQAERDAISKEWEAQQTLKDEAKLRSVSEQIKLAAEQIAARQEGEEIARAKDADRLATNAKDAEEGGGQGATRQQQSTPALPQPTLGAAAKETSAGDSLDAFIAGTEHLSSEQHKLEDDDSASVMPVRRLLRSVL